MHINKVVVTLVTKVKQWCKYLHWLEKKRIEAMIKAGRPW